MRRLLDLCWKLQILLLRRRKKKRIQLENFSHQTLISSCLFSIFTMKPCTNTVDFKTIQIDREQGQQRYIVVLHCRAHISRKGLITITRSQAPWGINKTIPTFQARISNIYIQLQILTNVIRASPEKKYMLFAENCNDYFMSSLVFKAVTLIGPTNWSFR